MGYEIYVNFLASMEAHIGVLVRQSHTGQVQDIEFARPKNPGDSSLLARVSVYVNGPNFPDVPVIDEVIDEGFKDIGIPEKTRMYSVPTTNGSFELMWRPGFPKDSRSAKHAMRVVLATLKAPGTAKSAYCGKPAQLFRYGKRHHLEEALKLGKFRLAPATSYKDLSGDPARQDNELCRIFERDPKSLIITTQEGVVLKPIGMVKFESRRADDYYVLCLSMEYSPAISAEFSGCEACLIINDPSEFTERLHTGVEKAVPGFTGFEAPVSYGTKSTFGVCFTKNNNYAKQSEFRFAWINTDLGAQSQELEPRFVEIGSIEDIAELVDLPTHLAPPQT